MKTVRFAGEECTLRFSRYPNDRLAIRLMCSEGPMAVATVNLPDEMLDEGYVFIKTYSENEGMLEALVSAGIVEDTGMRVNTGYVTVPICKLLIDPCNV